VEGLRADESRIAQHLEQSLMLVTALTPLLGYDKACAIARHAHAHNLSLRDSAVTLGGISAEAFDRCVNPRQMI
jgi:fumarate hydratase class II